LLIHRQPGVFARLQSEQIFLRLSAPDPALDPAP